MKAIKTFGTGIMAVVLSFITMSFTNCNNANNASAKPGEGGAVVESRQNLGNGIYLINGHKFVDLGLPSGMLWAETNVGAKKSADTGYFLAWGETKPKQEYSVNTYKWFDGKQSYIKYNDQGNDHQKLLRDDDAASANWGASCRMPTMLDFGELKENCTFTPADRTNSAGQLVYGYLVTSKTNGNKIFFPAAGAKSNNEYVGFNKGGMYWLKGQRAVCCANFIAIDLQRGEVDTSSMERYIGMTVRPVAEP